MPTAARVVVVPQEQGQPLDVVDCELADPGPHEVVVRVEAAPINPSDLGLLLGAMALFQIADHGLRDGGQGLRALALVQSRLEAKRAAPWNQLLLDDVNADGIVDVTMRDDGTQGDLQGGDGAYTATVEQAGIALLWTVRADRAGSLDRVGAVVVEARATYLLPSGRRRTLFLATIRANPNYVGERA